VHVWPVDALDQYLRCPLSYKFKYRDKIEVPHTISYYLEKLLMPRFLECLVRRTELDVKGPQSVLAELQVKIKLLQQDLAKHPLMARKVRPAAVRLFMDWYATHFRHWPTAREGMDVTGPFGTTKGRFYLSAHIPFVLRDGIVLYRFAPTHTLMKPSFADTMKSALCHSPNTVIVFIWTGRSQKVMRTQRHVITKLVVDRSLEAVKGALWGIKREFFPPAHPLSSFCHSARCPYYNYCMRERFSAK